MRNADYWRGRFSILEDSAHREAQKTIQDMEELYLDAQRSVQKEIESWYARFAVNNQISLTDARKWLTAGQLEEFHWSVEQYIKIGEQAGLDAAWLKKLENASARFHISRLEAVQTGIQQQLELLYGNQVDSLDALLKKVVGNGYTHTAFEVQKGVGLGWDITGLDQKKLETLLSKPWTTDGRTFRDRCWLNKNDLVGSVSKSLTQGLLRGDSPSKITTAIQKQKPPISTLLPQKRPIRNWALRMWRFWKRWIPSPVHFVQVWIEKWFPCRSFNRVLPFPRFIHIAEELRFPPLMKNIWVKEPQGIRMEKFTMSPVI